MSAWFAALRIARRDALRHRWRSLLIIILILAPVAGATGMDILYRTATSAELEKERSFGGADGIIYPDLSLPKADRPPVDGGFPKADQPTLAEIVATLPAGHRIIADPIVTEGVFATPGYRAESSLLISDHVGDSLATSRVRLLRARTFCTRRGGDQP